MKKIFKILYGRITPAIILIVLQLAFIITVMTRLCSCSALLKEIMNGVSIIMIIYLINKNENPMYTLAWSIIVLIFPPSGWILYFIVRRNFTKETIEEQEIPPPQGENENFGNLQFFRNISDLGVHYDSETIFFPNGEIFYKDLLLTLKNAEKYIYLEYFIINKGEVWNSIISILKNCSNRNIDIRIIYDDMCSPLFTEKYRKELESTGIKTAGFNIVRPFPGNFLNCRNHRKLAVIDGKYAYTGGINLSDEYMNITRRFGYWKDCALKISGSSVLCEAKSFRRMWHKCTGNCINSDDDYSCSENRLQGTGIVVPFDVVPDKKKKTAEMVYLKIISSAKKFVYITTPYLIPDSDMLSALKLSAVSGTDIRIITPRIPDKKYIFAVTRSYYRELIDYGIRIFEYKPGFIHSKTIVSDNISAVVCTANFDYRSFYLLYENGVYMYNTPAVEQMKTDFEETLEKSIEITKESLVKMPKIYRFFGAILKIFSPLM